MVIGDGRPDCDIIGTALKMCIVIETVIDQRGIGKKIIAEDMVPAQSTG